MAKNFLHSLVSKLLMIVVLILVFWIGNAALKEMERGKRIREEVTALQQEAQKIRKENNVLREKIEYFRTDAYQQQEAKDKLNYQSPDEQVVVIKPSVHDRTETEPIKDPIAMPLPKNLLPNYEKWWDQFFAS